MNLVFSFGLAVLVAVAVFLILRPSLVRAVIGVSLLGNAVNLSIFLFGGWKPGAVPIMNADQNVLPATATDPLPQALILTAIVIGFGMQAFLLILLASLKSEGGAALASDLEDSSQ